MGTRFLEAVADCMMSGVAVTLRPLDDLGTGMATGIVVGASKALDEADPARTVAGCERVGFDELLAAAEPERMLADALYAAVEPVRDAAADGAGVP